MESSKYENFKLATKGFFYLSLLIWLILTAIYGKDFGQVCGDIFLFVFFGIGLILISINDCIDCRQRMREINDYSATSVA